MSTGNRGRQLAGAAAVRLPWADFPDFAALREFEEELGSLLNDYPVTPATDPDQRSRNCWKSGVPWPGPGTWPSPCPPVTAGRDIRGRCKCCFSSSAATTT